MPADITKIQKRVVQLLNARPSDTNYSASPSGKNSSFLSTQEITDAILDADGMVVVEGYLSVPNHSMRTNFLTASANLANGSTIPQCIGAIGRVDLSDDGTTWAPGLESVKDDVLMARSLIEASLPYITTTDAKGFYAIADNSIYHTNVHARIYLPQFTKTAACQAHEGHEGAIIAGAMMLLKKDGSNAEHDFFTQQFYAMLPLIRQGATEVKMAPPIQ